MKHRREYNADPAGKFADSKTSLSRREFMGLLAGAAAGFAVPRPVIGEGDSPKPNFLFILCDDLGYGDLACYGNLVVKTPNLDRLAEEGMRLTDCYAGAPVCSPARAAIMTGRTPCRSGIRDWIPAGSAVHLKRQEISVAALLKSAGYATCHSGKWHLSGALDGSQPTPADHGFDRWFSTQNNAAPSHRNPDNFFRNGKPVGPLDGWSSSLIVDEAIAFIKSVKDKPFAVFVWFHAPHEPIATSDEFLKMYSHLDDPTRAVYCGCVTQMDQEVGRLIKTLDEMRLADRTFVMFMSDNGPETLRRYGAAKYSHGSPGPLRGMKLHLYEGGIRVPGIIRWPGHTKPGQVCREPVNGTDVLPTFCELAGVKVPTDRAVDGASILPVFSGKPVERRIPLYWRYDKALGGPELAIRQGNWKLLAEKGFSGLELYNLEDDPKETADLSAKEPDRLKAMLATMKKLHREIEEDPLSR